MLELMNANSIVYQIKIKMVNKETNGESELVILLRLNGKGDNLCFGYFDPRGYGHIFVPFKKIVIMFCQMEVIWPTIFLFFPLYL